MVAGASMVMANKVVLKMIPGRHSLSDEPEHQVMNSSQRAANCHRVSSSEGVLVS